MNLSLKGHSKWLNHNLVRRMTLWPETLWLERHFGWDLATFFRQLSKLRTNNIFMIFFREEKWFKNGVRVEKEDLINVKVLGQIDDKFIAIVTQNTNFLLLLDQHAVDERIRLEKLLARKFITSKHKITNSLNDNILLRIFFYFHCNYSIIGPVNPEKNEVCKTFGLPLLWIKRIRLEKLLASKSKETFQFLLK